MTYQKVTGCLNQGAHPGSYNGQDAYSDMLVVDDGIFNTTNRRVQGFGTGINACGTDVQERNRFSPHGEREVNAALSEPAQMSEHEGHNNGVTSVVRRLTPRECERLQGFPDDWSRYGLNEQGKVYELSDSARYRLQGNSIARPFWTWLLKRIAAQYDRKPSLGSLFDGQGGFILCAHEAEIETPWASEIEKHAIAVTKYHFGDANSERTEP